MNKDRGHDRSRPRQGVQTSHEYRLAREEVWSGRSPERNRKRGKNIERRDGKEEANLRAGSRSPAKSAVYPLWLI